MTVTGRVITPRLVSIVVAAAVVLTLAACGSSRELVGYQVEPLPQVDQTALPDVANGGEPFSLVGPEGGLLVVYFGYLNCPDYCPTTLTAVNGALERLGDDAERVEVAMVTVDPERDTDGLADYVASMVPGGHAIATDDIQTLRDVAFSFGAEFQVTKRGGDVVTVDHTTHLYAVDENGNLVITWPYGVAPSDLAADLRQLLDSTG